MIYPVTISDEDLLVLQKKINRLRGGVTLADVREKVSELIDDYVEYELLEEVWEEYE